MKKLSTANARKSSFECSKAMYAVALARLQRALRARNVLNARVDGYGLAQCFGRGFENRFGDVVVVGAVGNLNVQVQLCVGGDGLEEFFDQLRREVADGGAGEIYAENKGGAAGEIERDLRQAFVHWNQCPAVALDAALVAKSLIDRLSNDDADVFD